MSDFKDLTYNDKLMYSDEIDYEVLVETEPYIW